MKAIIVDANSHLIDSSMRNEMLEWARGLGVDTKIAMARFMLVEHVDGWHAHFGMKRQRNGHDYMEPGTNRVAADFDLEIPVAEKSWPGWFGEVVRFPDMKPADLLELMAIIEDALSQSRAAAAYHAKYGAEVQA